MTKLNGNDLIAIGFIPAPWFSEVLTQANEESMSISQMARIAQSKVDEIEKLEAIRRAREIPLHNDPAPFQFNITAENADEHQNVEAVRKTFEILMRTPVLEEGVVMPDACPAGPVGTIPVGGVIAARNAILPGAHSADICCSMTATIIEGASPAEMLDAIHAVTHFGPGGRKPGEQFPLPQSLRDAFAENDFLRSQKIQARARSDFGSCGDGNHFNFVGISENTGKTVLVSHFGSRGPGALLYKDGMKLAEEFRADISPQTQKENAWIPFDTAEGQSYWEALQIIREWTKQSHAALHDAAISQVREAEAEDRLWNEHNFVFKEDDDKGSLFWHAKGATPIHTPLLPDTSGVQIIPLNMTQPILFVSGKRNETNRGFAPHGAGRNLSRTAHKRSFEDETDQSIFDRETAGIDARFYCGKVDISELPTAYKNADRVLADINRFDLCDIIDRIIPHGSIMAGDFLEEAPWKKKAKAKAALKAANVNT